MKLNKEKSEFLDEMISTWEDEHLIEPHQAENLRKSYETKVFDWRKLAEYAFRIAMACGVIAMGAFLIDNKVLDLLKRLYDTPNILISLLSAIIAAGLYIFGLKRRKSHKDQVFSNEAILFMGVMFTANAIAYFGKSIDNGSGHFSLLLLLSVIIYATLALVFQSKLVWIFSLLSLGAWFGTETGYLSRWNWYFAGMNYPLRFVFFGLALTALSFVFRKQPRLSPYFQVTYFCGMLYLFISLWLLSIFGNFGSLTDWFNVKQMSLFYWALLSGIVCLATVFIGLKKNDDIAREFGITFLFINLYTRYFEYFWDSWHKALFFLVLAISFWLIGRRAEKIWHAEFLKMGKNP